MKWNDNAKHYIKEYENSNKKNLYNFYIFDLYKKLVRDTFHDYPKHSKIRVLKTDLWDFVVERDRDVLSYVYKLNPKWEYFAIDISLEIVKKAELLDGKNIFKCSTGDICKLSFDKNYFDLIYDFSTIDHIKENELGTVFSEYFRVLKPGGRALIIFWQDSWYLRQLSKIYKVLAGKSIIDNSDPDKFQYYFKPHNIIEIARDNGFIIKKNKFYLGFLLNIFRGPVKMLYNILPKIFFKILVKFELSRFSFLFKPFSSLCAIEIIKPYSLSEIQNHWNSKIISNEYKYSGVLWNNDNLWNKFIDIEQRILLRNYVQKIKKNDYVLDFGCGIGRLSKVFAQKSVNVFGIDTSSDAIIFCKNNLQKICKSFFSGSIQESNYGRNYFDYIFSITSLQSINSLPVLVNVFNEFHNILKDHGQVILIESITDNRGDPLVLDLNEKDFNKLIFDCGFKIIKKRNIDNLFLRSFYMKINKNIIMIPFRLLLISIIFIIEVTFFGYFFRRRGWYKMYVLEKI